MTEKKPVDFSLLSPEMKEEISVKAREKAMNARWDINIAIILFGVLILIIILVTYTRAGLEVVAPVAAAGLSAVWFTGWQRGKRLYRIFYREEITRVERELKKAARDSISEKIEETIEEQIQRALRERWKSG